MKKILPFLFAFIAILHVQNIYTQTNNTQQSGEWTDHATWAGNNNSTPTDTLTGQGNNQAALIINTNHTVHTNHGLRFEGNGGSITIHGELIINGDLIITGNNWEINVSVGAIFTVNGNVQFDQAAQSNQASPDLTINGLASILGTFTGTGNVLGTGTLTIENDDSTVNPLGENIVVQGFNGTIIVNGSTLPIELLSFEVTATGHFVELHWVTAAEINNMGFEIQRLEPETNIWEAIGFVPGNYNHNGLLYYSFTDFDPIDGTGYYKLKQMDYDGAFELFGPVAVGTVFSTEESKITMIRSSHYMRFVLPGNAAGQIEIFDMSGRPVISQYVNSQTDIPLTKGAYLVRFTNSEQVLTTKFVF